MTIRKNCWIVSISSSVSTWMGDRNAPTFSKTGWFASAGQSACITNYFVLPTVLMLFLHLKFPRVKTTKKMIKVKRRNQKWKAKSLHLTLPLDKFLMKTQKIWSTQRRILIWGYSPTGCFFWSTLCCLSQMDHLAQLLGQNARNICKTTGFSNL